ncbi:MAG: fibronectin type III domain-containing protein [Thermodesulfobacteriota bacterium]
MLDDQLASNGTSFRAGVFLRAADGSEGGTNVNFATSSAEEASVHLYRVSNWHGTIGLGVNGDVATDANTEELTANPPNVSPFWGAEDTLWLAFFGASDSNVTGVDSYPANFTHGVFTHTGFDTSSTQIASCRRELNQPSNNPDAFDFSGGGTARWVAYTIAVRPAEFTAVPKSVSGASTNSGVLSTRISVVKALTGVSVNSGSLASFVNRIQAIAGAAANAGALAKKVLKAIAGTSADTGELAADDLFSARWSFEHLEAAVTHGFPTVYVEVNDGAMPSGAFPAGTFFERRILEVPRLEEVELDSRFGISGFRRTTLVLDNTDGYFNARDMQGMYIRMFFVNAEGTAYKEFKGQVVDWTLSHRVTLNIEDVDAITLTQDFPKRSLNELVEAEKIADAGFEDVVIANDLGKPVPIIFGRAIKVPLLYVKADEASREYDYIIGEGIGLNDNPFQEVFTVYRNDQALDEINGDVAAATSTTLTLETADKRPDSWYRYWWVEITAGTGVGQIRYVTAYDSANNRITISSAWSVTPNTGSDYKLSEWRFYDGSQVSPYAGYAFIRFKKRMGVSGRTDPLYADVNGLSDETNPVRAIQSLLGNPDWGLGIDVDTASFNTAAGLSAISSMLCEGVIADTTGAVDVFRELLGFRDMVLSKDDTIRIAVDQAKVSSINLGLGDETGWNNILTGSPEIFHIHPNEKVRNLKVKYRKNNKENDVYLHELERQSSTNGIDTTVNLPFIYEHATADRWLDYKRKRLLAAVKRLSLGIGQEGQEILRGDLATVTIATLGMNAQSWEVTGASVTPAGENTVSLVPYSASPYTYVPITSEGGTLPVDESFDIPPDYDKSIPDPVSGVSVTMSMGIVGFTAHPFATITWTAPEDNYGGAVISTKLHSDATTLFRVVGTYTGTTARIEGLVPGQLYDFLIESLNVTGELKGLGVTVNNGGAGYIAGGDSTAPGTWTHNLTGGAKFGKLFWTWNKHPEADVAYYEAELNTSTSGGVLGKEIIPHLNDVDFKPRYEIEIQTGDLTNPITRALRIRAVDHSGNKSGWTTPLIAASTGDVGRDDLHNNATMDIEIATAPGEQPGINQTQSVWYEVISVTISTDRTGVVKVHYTGQFTGSGNGYAVRLLRGSTVLRTFSNISVEGKYPVSLNYVESIGAGTKTYKIETRNTVAGGIGLGLLNNSLSVQGDFK